MADHEIDPQTFSPDFRFFSGNPTPLKAWGTPEPSYEYLFVVKITDTDPQAPHCEVYRAPAPVNKQAMLTEQHIIDAVTSGTIVNDPPHDELDLILNSRDGALVAFLLAEARSTFERQNSPNDVTTVIVRKAYQRHLLYQPNWVATAAANTAFSVVLGPDAGWRGSVSYGLRVRAVSAAGNVSYLDIDPSVENNGEGGGFGGEPEKKRRASR